MSRMQYVSGRFGALALPVMAVFFGVGCPAPPPSPPPNVQIEPPPAVPTAVPTTAPSASASAPVFPERRSAAVLAPWAPPSRSSSAVCKVIHKAQEKASKSDASPPEEAPGAAPFPPPCFPTASGGAWGLIQSINGYHQNDLNAVMHPTCGPGTDAGPCLYDAELSFVPMHVSKQGAKASGTAVSLTTFSDGGVQAEEFDFDGDGEEELILVEGAPTIWTSQGGKVSPYSPSKGLSFVRLVDADGDKRPDLLLANPYDASADLLRCGKWGGHPVLGFFVETSLIAHALPDGTFTTDDALTQRLAKTLCPSRPSPIVMRNGGKFDHGWIRDNVVCARLWGASADEVVSELERDCKWPAEEECTALFDARDNGITDTCVGHEELVKWANVVPPIRLRQ